MRSLSRRATPGPPRYGASFLIILNPLTHSLTHARARSLSLSGALGHAVWISRGERALLVRAHKLAGLVGDLAEDARDELR